MTNDITLDQFLSTDRPVKVYVSSDTNRMFSGVMTAWSCRIRERNGDGMLVDVFVPAPSAQGQTPWMVFLPWSSVLGVTAG